METKREIPWYNLFAAILCLASGVKALVDRRYVFGTILLVTGSANAWLVVRRLFSKTQQEKP